MSTILSRCPNCGGLTDRPEAPCPACRQEAVDAGVEDVRRSFTELWADEGAKWSGVAAGIATGGVLALLATMITHGAALNWIVLQLNGGQGRIAFLWHSLPFWVVRIVAEVQARFSRGAFDFFEEESFAIGSIVALVLGVALLSGAYLAYHPAYVQHPVPPAELRISVWWLTPWLCQAAGIASGVMLFRRLRERIL